MSDKVIKMYKNLRNLSGNMTAPLPRTDQPTSPYSRDYYHDDISTKPIRHCQIIDCHNIKSARLE